MAIRSAGTGSRSLARGWRALALPLLCLAPSGLAARAPDPAPAQIKATVEALYAIYRREPMRPGYSENLAPYTRRTRDLIRQWQAHQPRDEVTTFSDFDWFCQCQDWDSKRFAVLSTTVRKMRGPGYEVAVSYDLGWNARRRIRFVMLREEGGWKVDDILFADPSGMPSLRAGLTAELKEQAR